MTKAVRQKVSWIVALGMATFLLCPPAASAATNLAAISGIVHSATGAPLVGALVTIASSSSAKHMVLTDQRGSFSFPNLFAGEYSVKVTLSRFLPATKAGLQLTNGGNLVLTVNLQTAIDVVRQALAGQKSQNQDIVWTLRSSRSTQPILYLTAEKTDQEKASSAAQDYSGNLELYSKSVDTPGGADEGVGSQFSVTKPLDSKSKIAVAGLYSDSPNQPRGFGARYDYTASERRHSTVGVGMKQGALVTDPSAPQAAHDIQADYKEDFQWTDHWVFDYGASLGRSGSLTTQSYFRPQFSMSWVPDRRTTFTATSSEEAPVMPGDPARGQDYLERSIYINPAEQHYSHSEVGMSRVISDDTRFSVAIYKDRADTEALFFSSADGTSGIVILDTSRIPTQGARIYFSHRFRNIEAGAGYTAATGLGFSPAAGVADLSHQVERRQFQVVTTKVKGTLDATQTEVTAIYRWMSNFSASEIDAYQREVDTNDPTLSFSIAQNLPAWRMFPGRLQAVLDARNLLDHPYGTQNVQLAQSPRFLKGGINFKF